VPRNNTNVVRKLVGRNFDREVLNNDLDVLVNFYASWDKDSRLFNKEYNVIANTLSANRNLLLAKIDMTQNEVDGIVI
jgi:thioredoxin-like negative regulator of GroEL